MIIKQIKKAAFICLLAAMQLLSCQKSGQQGHESFSFNGTVNECYTNAALGNVHVRVVAKSLSNGGFFNSAYDAGSAYTDSYGKYSINPLKYPGITDFEIYFEKDGYVSNGIEIEADTLSGAKSYSFGSTMGKLTYLKLILNDSHPFDATDRLYLQLIPLASCVNYTPVYAGGNLAVDSNLANTIGITGLIQNGSVIYRVNANDTCFIQYHCWKDNIMGAFFTNSCFCAAGDTTIQYLNY